MELDQARHVVESRKKKIAVTEREFLWVRDDDKGDVTLHVGPTMVAPTAADRVVVDDGNGGFREDYQGEPQRMIEVSDNQYAALFNPIANDDRNGEGPNGAFKIGRNESRKLANGTRQMIPGPCSFFLRPGQRCEVRNAHELGSNQYLVVKVYGSVDKEAPFYEVTAKSAGIKSFTAKALDADTPTTTGKEKPDAKKKKLSSLTRGQLVVIRGLDTQFYIPPTGVDIVPDTSTDSSGGSITGEAAKEILAKALNTPELYTGGMAMAASASNAVADSNIQTISTSYDAAAPDGFESLRSLSAGAKGFAKGFAPRGGGRARRKSQPKKDYAGLISNLSNSPQLQDELERAAGQTRLVRNAVVLTEKEFCVITDADGRRNVKVGPARVFPGPYDTFMTEGSSNRVYNAYELLPQRALWLRVLTKSLKAELLKKLPQGAQVPKGTYHPGDEILLTGLNAFFFPFNEIEVLNPETGQAEVGNEHERVFIDAVGIDQKSGIYVRDLETGEARLVRGKRSYLINPAKEVHINRIVSPIDWNHWITAQRPHKQETRPVVTPWALSIRIPHNMAVLATSAKGQRVIEGPCVELLEYEEKLAYLNLSTGTPKSDKQPLKTCFLKTAGNRVSDRIRVETSDFVEIDVEITFNVDFRAGAKGEFREKWFNHDNYVQVIIEHARSLVRRSCRKIPLAELWVNMADTIRDIVLGKKIKGERPGRLFSENGMVVTEVEVLQSKILDKELEVEFTAVQREIVRLSIGDRQAEARLASTKFRADINAKESKVTEQDRREKCRLEDVLRGLGRETNLAETAVFQEKQLVDLKNKTERQGADQQARLARERIEVDAANQLLIDTAKSRLEATTLNNQGSVGLARDKAGVEMSLIDARAKATTAENQSIQTGLVEALTALGDKQFLTTAAENMNLVSLIKGKSVGKLLSDVLSGTKVMDTLEKMKPKLGEAIE